MPGHTARSPCFCAALDKQPGKIIATIKDATKKFGSNTILKMQRQEINRGDKIALIGAKNEGKNQMPLRMIVGSEPFEGGVNRGHNVDESFYAQHQLEALNINNTILAVWGLHRKYPTNHFEFVVRHQCGQLLGGKRGVLVEHTPYSQQYIKQPVRNIEY